MRQWLILGGLLAQVISAPARTEPSPSPQATAPENPGKDATSALIDQAAREYDQGRWDQALRTLTSARALSARPLILYDIAQVLRAQEDCVAAQEAYRQFIAATAPDDPDRARAVRHQLEMQACVDRLRVRPGAAAGTSTPARKPSVRLRLLAPAPDPPGYGITAAGSVPSRGADTSASAGRARTRHAVRTAAWSLVGVGAAAAVAAGVLAWQAARLSTQVSSTLSAPAPAWTDHLQSTQDDGSRDAHWARWSGAAAVLAAGGGVAALLIWRTPAPFVAPSQSAAVAGGTLVGWSGSF